MANRAFKLTGNYTDYIVNGDAVASIDGDWVRIPPNARAVSVQYELTDTNSPVGTLTFEGTSVQTPDGSTSGVALYLNPTTGSATASVSLDGIGAKNSYLTLNLAINHPRWFRVRYARSSGGASDLLNVRVRASL